MMVINFLSLDFSKMGIKRAPSPQYCGRNKLSPLLLRSLLKPLHHQKHCFSKS